MEARAEALARMAENFQIYSGDSGELNGAG